MTTDPITPAQRRRIDADFAWLRANCRKLAYGFGAATNGGWTPEAKRYMLEMFTEMTSLTIEDAKAKVQELERARRPAAEAGGSNNP